MATEHFKKALEIAKRSRARKVAMTGAKQTTTATPFIKPAAKNESNDFTKLQYTFTRIQNIDEKILRQNRVIAGFRDDPRSAPFRVLRTQILHEMEKNNWNTLGVTSPHSGAGKSLVAANLAVSISLLTRQTVLLVDLDLRNPSIHQYFSLDNSNGGISDYLNGKVSLQNILVNPGYERLVILPGSEPTNASSELLSSKKAQEMLDEIRTRYHNRIVIYDLPPLLGIDDAMVVLPKIDTNILVIEANRTTATETRSAIQLLDEYSVIGTVFNKADEVLDIQYGY